MPGSPARRASRSTAAAARSSSETVVTVARKRVTPRASKRRLDRIERLVVARHLDSRRRR
jgi:hypothetical protein